MDDSCGIASQKPEETRPENPRELIPALEAILFAAGEPVAVKRIAEVLQASPEALQRAAEALAGQYSYEQRGLRLLVMDGHFQLCSAPEYADVIRQTLEERKPPPMSRAALEVLSLAAYYQPVTRAYIDRVRGVESGATVAKLCEKGLLEESGRLEVPGRPLLYRTTTGFLRAFGLRSLEELPNPDSEEGAQGGQVTFEEIEAAQSKAETLPEESNTEEILPEPDSGERAGTP